MLRFTNNLIMQITKDCNLRCSYCFQGDKSSWKDKQISFEDFKQIVDTTLYYRCVLGRLENYIDFHFHGGEVTLIPFKTLEQMVEYLVERKKLFPNITCCIQSNGTLLTEDICNLFKKYDVTIGISLDGIRSPNRFEDNFSKKLIENIKNLAEKTKCKFSFLSVLTTDTIPHWFEDMMFLKEYLGDSFAGTGINVLSTASTADDNLIPTADQLWDYWAYPVLNSYIQGNPLKERGINIALSKLLQDIIFESNLQEYSGIKTGCFDRLCGRGSNMTSIDPELNLFKCDKYMENGDFIGLKKGIPLNNRDFLGMQTANECIKYYKQIFELEKQFNCDYCPARWVCSGECQSAIISKFGKPMLFEENCKLFKKIYNFVNDNWVDILCNYKEYMSITGKVQRVKNTANEAFLKNNVRLEYNIDNNMYKCYRV